MRRLPRGFGATGPRRAGVLSATVWPYGLWGSDGAEYFEERDSRRSRRRRGNDRSGRGRRARESRSLCRVGRRCTGRRGSDSVHRRRGRGNRGLLPPRLPTGQGTPPPHREAEVARSDRMAAGLDGGARWGPRLSFRLSPRLAALLTVVGDGSDSARTWVGGRPCPRSGPRAGRAEGGRGRTSVVWRKRLRRTVAPAARGKFGPYASDVALAWLIGRMAQRANARRRGTGDRLGYLRGGLGALARRYEKEISGQGVRVSCGTPADSLVREGDRWRVRFGGRRSSEDSGMIGSIWSIRPHQCARRPDVGHRAR